MPPVITQAQAETLEELFDNSYGSLGFLPHEQFTERDNRANGARRCMYALIKRGLIVKDERTTDAHGNHYHIITPEAVEAYQAYMRREWEKEATRARKRPVVAQENW
jgi:hypothetical protein